MVNVEEMSFRENKVAGHFQVAKCPAGNENMGHINSNNFNNYCEQASEKLPRGKTQIPLLSIAHEIPLYRSDDIVFLIKSLIKIESKNLIYP